MKMPTNENELRVYALGYVDGNVHGVEDSNKTLEMRYWYKRGYDAGIADYCTEENKFEGETK